MPSNLDINLRADTTNFETALKNADRIFADFAKHGGDVSSAIAKSFKAIADVGKSSIDALDKALTSLGTKSDISIQFDTRSVDNAKNKVMSFWADLEKAGTASLSEQQSAWRKMQIAIENIDAKRLSGQFRELGVQSQASIEALKLKTIEAFNEIERVGTKYPQDLVRANEAMVAELARLDGLLLTNAEKVAAERKLIEVDTANAIMGVYADAQSMNQKYNYDRLRSAEKVAAELRAIRRSEVEAANNYGTQNQGKTSDRMQNSFDTLGIKSSLNIEAEKAKLVAAFNEIKNSGVASANEIKSAHRAMRTEIDKLDSKPIEKATESMNLFGLASVATIAKIQILYSLINSAMSAIGSAPGIAVQAIESYNSSTITNAAMITSMQTGVKDVGKAYQENKKYATAVEEVLIKMDAETAASAKNLRDMNSQFVQQGILMDVNNRKQIDGFKSVANALSAITANDPNQAMQYAQEIRALRSFEDKGSNRLVQMLIAQGVTKEMFNQWKASDTVLEEMGKRLQGFAAAQGDINNLWVTVKSTMETIRDGVLRDGLAPEFAKLVKYMKELTERAKEHKDEIAQGIHKAWLAVKGVVESISELYKVQTQLLEAMGLKSNSIFEGWGMLLGVVLPTVTEKFVALWTIIGDMVNGTVLLASGFVTLMGTLGTGVISLGKASKQALFGDFEGAGKTLANAFEGQFLEASKKILAAVKTTGADIKKQAQLVWGLDSFDTRMASWNEKKEKKVEGPYPDTPSGMKVGTGGGGAEGKGAASNWNSFTDIFNAMSNNAEESPLAKSLAQLEDKADKANKAFESLTKAEQAQSNAQDATFGGTLKAIEVLKQLDAEKIKGDYWSKTSLVTIREETKANEAFAKSILLSSKAIELKTNRYKVTPLSKYGLNTDFYGIKQQGESESEINGRNKSINDFNNLSNELSIGEEDPHQKQLRSLEKFYEAKSQIIMDYQGKEADASEKQWKMLGKLDEDYISQREKFEKQTRDKNITSIANNLGQIGQIMMKGNKDQFEAGKAFAIASAMINTYMAASAAFSGITSSTGGWGIAAGIAAGAMAIATGMAQVAAISSTSYQAREFGGPVTAGQSYIVGEKRPELFTPGASGVITPYVPESKGGAGGHTIVYQISTGVADTVRAEVMRLAPALTQMTLSAVGANINGGGDLAYAVGRA